MVEITDSIRRARKERIREIQRERDMLRDGWEEQIHHHHHHHNHRGGPGPVRGHPHDGDRLVEREVVLDRTYPPGGGYIR